MYNTHTHTHILIEICTRFDLKARMQESENEKKEKG